jgi:S1-C subfamily serine protease
MRQTTKMLTCLAVLWGMSLGPARSQEADQDAAYRAAVDAVALVVAYDQNWEPICGTGVVVDSEGGLLVTAFHVVEATRMVGVIFPKRDQNGELVTKLEPQDVVLKCVVVARDAKRDLALIRIKPEFEKPKSLRLAERSASPGAAVFTIGSNPDLSVLWRFSGGHVRQVYVDKFQFKNGQAIDSRVVEVTAPINPGYSGGPIINRAGELVGINSATETESNQVHKGIDILEIRSFLTNAIQPKPEK